MQQPPSRCSQGPQPVLPRSQRSSNLDPCCHSLVQHSSTAHDDQCVDKELARCLEVPVWQIFVEQLARTFHPQHCIGELLQQCGKDIQSSASWQIPTLQFQQANFQKKLVFETSIRCGHSLQQQSKATTTTSPLAWIRATSATTHLIPEMLYVLNAPLLSSSVAESGNHSISNPLPCSDTQGNLESAPIVQQHGTMPTPTTLQASTAILSSIKVLFQI